MILQLPVSGGEGTPFGLGSGLTPALIPQATRMTAGLSRGARSATYLMVSNAFKIQHFGFDVQRLTKDTNKWGSSLKQFQFPLIVSSLPKTWQVRAVGPRQAHSCEGTFLENSLPS